MPNILVPETCLQSAALDTGARRSYVPDYRDIDSTHAIDS